MTEPGPLALSGITVVAVEQFGAGPWATLQLADLGAEVIKIEDPTSGGDIGRYVPPYQQGEDSLYFETFNRGKLSLSLDLREPDARAVFEDLVAGVDAVFSNLRGDVVETLGLRYEQLRRFNERIVCCALSGYGSNGPRSRQGGYDHTVQGIAGWQSLTGDPSDPPTKSGLSLVDFSSGYAAATALLAALLQAQRTGKGCDIDLSLQEIALSQLTYLATWATSRGYEPGRRPFSSHPSIVPFQNFRTADGWIVVACPKQSFWRRLCQALEREQLADDERFATFAARERNRDELLELLDGELAALPTDAWIDRLVEAGVPCAPINDVATALEDEQVHARELMVDIEHPTLGHVRQVGSPLRLSSGRAEPRRAPFRGEHTREVLARICGYQRERIDDLAGRGILGAT